MFHIVASTESNHLKLLMIIGNVKQTVTYMEFEKKYIFGKQGCSSTTWEKVSLFILRNAFFVLLCFFFFFFIVERFMQATVEV